MKATILLAVCILCGESKLESGFTGASHPAPESPIAVRHERQVRSCTDDELRMRVNLARCDPNYGQRVVDIFVNCSGDYLTSARRFIGSCSRNENGRFCFEFDSDPLLSDCPTLSTYSNYNCTDMCRAALQSLKSNLGCYLNSRFNISDYDRNFQLFNSAGLWSAVFKVRKEDAVLCLVLLSVPGIPEALWGICGDSQLQDPQGVLVFQDNKIWP